MRTKHLILPLLALICFQANVSAAPGKGDKVERQKRRASAPPRMESGITTPGGSRSHYQALPETKDHYVKMPEPPASEIRKELRRDRRKAGNFAVEAQKAERLARRNGGNFTGDARQAVADAHSQAAAAENRRSVMMDALNTSVERQYDRIPAELRRSNSDGAREGRASMNAEALRRSASFNGSPVAGGSATSSTSAAERRGSGVYQNFNEVRAAQDRVQRGVGTSREHMGKVTPARSGPVVITTSPDGKTTYRAESSSSSRERSAGAAEIKSPGERTSGGGSEIKTPGERTAGSSSTTERSGEIRQPGEKTVKEKAAEINEKDKAEREAKAAAEKAAAERKVTAEKAAAEKAAAEKKQAEKAGKRHK